MLEGVLTWFYMREVGGVLTWFYMREVGRGFNVVLQIYCQGTSRFLAQGGGGGDDCS